MLNYVQVVQARRSTTTRSTAARSCATSTARAADRRPPTARCWRKSVPSTTGDQFEFQRDLPRGRPVRPRHRLLLVQLRLDRRRAGSTTTSSPAQTARSSTRRSRDLFVDATTPATSRSPCARTCNRRPGRARHRKGSVVVHRPAKTGEILAMWSFPSYDPNPLVARRSRHGARRRSCSNRVRTSRRCGRTYQERSSRGRRSRS